tara:strand:- start:92 stop:415 length:324 start_codon:yes stop_codon:yes gene_type:complete
MTKTVYGSRRARKLAGLTTKKPAPKRYTVEQILKGILKRPARPRTKARRKKLAPRVKWADRVIQGKIPMKLDGFQELIPHLKIAADPVLPPEPKLDTPKIEAMFEKI